MNDSPDLGRLIAKDQLFLEIHHLIILSIKAMVMFNFFLISDFIKIRVILIKSLISEGNESKLLPSNQILQK